MAKRLQCIVTGKEYVFADSYYDKKVQKAGDEESLINSYISKEAKKLLRLGNSVKKVREILDMGVNLPEPDLEIINQLVFKNKFNDFTDCTSLTSITHNQTDEEVKLFINKII